MIVLRGVPFPRAWCASGALNFCGESYPYRRLLGPAAPDFRGAAFVAKTATVDPRAGNMPLRGTVPRELFPRCIRVNFRRAAVLNAVGLSGPGLAALLALGRWQARTAPFFLSFAAVGPDRAARTVEADRFGALLAAARPGFRAPFGLQVNLSCPNVDHAATSAEGRDVLSILGARLPGVPLVPKVNALTPPDVALDLARHPDCAALCVGNTIPYGARPDVVDWAGLFGVPSPLAHLGGGGLSGAPIFPLVRDWVLAAIAAGLPVPLVAGGGVVRREDAAALLSHKAVAVEVGSAAIVRPWRVRGIVASVNGGRPCNR